jgi:hypothetical protein
LVIGGVAGIHRCEQKLRQERERRRVLHGSFIRSRVDNSTRTSEESASDPTEAALQL